MRIAILAPSFPPAFRGGGPARTLHALARAAPNDFKESVFAPDRDAGGADRLPVRSNEWSTFDGLAAYYASADRVMKFGKMFREVRRTDPDAIYLNSLFNLKFSILPRILVALRYIPAKQVLIAPRGELDAGALKIRSRKKQVFIWWYRTLRLHRGVVWHASTGDEAQAIRAVWGTAATVLVRENETLLPDEPSTPVAHSGPLRTVFYSRLSPKKGLLMALESLRDVDEALVFDVYGPEEDQAYVAACQVAANALSNNITVRFLGPIKPENARTMLAEYDVMLLPTAGENFGHVIAEALSVSCSVAVPDTTPWTALLRSGGGCVVAPNDQRSWSKAITNLARMSPDTRLTLRFDAGKAYSAWRSKPSKRHVFEMLGDVEASRG